MVFFLRRFVQVVIYGSVFSGKIIGIKTVIMNFTVLVGIPHQQQKRLFQLGSSFLALCVSQETPAFYTVVAIIHQQH